MQYEFTPGAGRALTCASGWSGGTGPDELQPPAVLLGLLAEPECRAAMMLARHGVDTAAVRRRWADLTPRKAPHQVVSAARQRFSADLQVSLQVACERMAGFPPPLELATEHLLLGLVAAGHEASVWLRQQGLDPDALEVEIHRLYGHRTGSLPLDPDQPFPAEIVDGDWTFAEDAGSGEETAVCDCHPGVDRENAAGGPTAPEGGHGKGVAPSSPETTPQKQIRVLRVIDAAANRAGEGLRAVEDYLRFVLDDRHLTRLCKQLRHDLTTVLCRVAGRHRLAARETRADVGTSLATPSEQHRESAAGVLAANFTRVQEALRSLEEFAKLLDVDMAAELERLRYRSYTLQRAVEITRSSLERLGRARLYVLIDGRPSLEEFELLARSLVEAGVHVLQLREKQLDDRRLLQRARLLRDLTRGSDTLFIINDRPDLAALAWADGVHVGQEELSVKDARTLLGPEALVGVSTHSIQQARQAVLDGADSIGVGPTFPSGTKHFEHFPGVELLRAVAAEIRLPAFAIGGITRENLPEVLSAGFTRVAVAGAITTASDPATEVREMLAILEGSAG